MIADNLISRLWKPLISLKKESHLVVDNLQFSHLVADNSSHKRYFSTFVSWRWHFIVDNSCRQPRFLVCGGPNQRIMLNIARLNKTEYTVEARIQVYHAYVLNGYDETTETGVKYKHSLQYKWAIANLATESSQMQDINK